MLSLQDTNSLIWLQGVQFSFYPINLQYFRTKYTERGLPLPSKLYQRGEGGGANNCKKIKIFDKPTTVGSRSTKTALGTCFPAPVSEKNVLKESSPAPIVLSEGICPSGWIPLKKTQKKHVI